MLDAEDVGRILMAFILGSAAIAFGCFIVGMAFGFIALGFRLIAG